MATIDNDAKLVLENPLQRCRLSRVELNAYDVDFCDRVHSSYAFVEFRSSRDAETAYDDM